ncbi:MAG: TonB-dependent receptor [Bacteroidales bacterium]|nr:TonB-dependent receptor [Bacteroidales bacterium]
MNRDLVLLLLLLVAGLPPVFAQTSLSGEVREKKTKEPVAGAFVLGLAGSQQKVYAYSDGEGQFELKVPEGVVLDQLRVSMMGFAAVTLPLQPGRTTGIVVELEEKRTELRAAKVTASVVEEKGDTLSFTAGAFKDGTERTMGDLLEKLPGITVSASGGIQHNGKAIGKLYVEGLDLMGAQYGTVTKNLSADAIARVEVYRNHQPVRALQDLSQTDRSAINIILKESVRSTWLFSGDAALGLPPLPLFEARAMLSNFGKKRQSLFLVKGNNTGGDILQELQRQSILGRGPGAYLITPGEVDGDFRSRLNPGRSYLSIPKEYWYDNLSGLGTFNHLVKTGEYSQLRVVTQVAGERYDETAGSQEEIRFADGTALILTETRTMTDRRGFFSGTVSFEDNAPGRYVSDELTLSGQLRTNVSSLDGNRTLYGQHYDLPSLKIENQLRIVQRRSARQAVEWTSDSKYRRGTHEARYETGGVSYGQHLFFQDFSTGLRASQNWSKGRHRIGLTGGAALNYVNREAQAENLPLTPALSDVKTKGSLSVLALEPSVRVSDAISLGDVQLTFALPATVHGLLIQGRDNLLYPTIDPSATLRYKASRRLEIAASSSYSLGRSGIESLLDAAVMTSWRSLSESDSLRRTTRWNNQFSLRWSDMVSMFFVTLSANYAAAGGDRLAASRWTETLTYQYYLPLETATSGWGVNGSLKKYVGLRAFVVELEGGWMENTMQEYLQGVAAGYRSAQLHTQLNFTSNPVTWFSTRLTGRCDINYVTGAVTQRTRMVQVEGSLRIKPVPALALDATGHWLWNEIPGVTVSNTPLVKVSAAWSLKKATLFAECRNLLGATEYRRESVSAYRTTSAVTALHGRSFLLGLRMTR